MVPGKDEKFEQNFDKDNHNSLNVSKCETVYTLVFLNMGLLMLESIDKIPCEVIYRTRE